MLGTATTGTPSKKQPKRRAQDRVSLPAVIFLFVITATCLFVSQKVYSEKHNRSSVPSRAAQASAASATSPSAAGVGAQFQQRAEAEAGGRGSSVDASVQQQNRDKGGASSKASNPREHHLNSRLAAQARPLRDVRDTFGAEAWHSCAVVGNSGNALLGKGHGARIDAHDAVIRLNLAPLDGHREDLGQVTTVSFMNGWKLHGCASTAGGCSCWSHYREGNGVFVVAYPIEAEHMKDGEECKRINSSKFHLVTEDFKAFSNQIVYHYTSERIKRNFPEEMWAKLAEERRKVKLHYSSGFQAVLFAASLCDEVSLFGFGKGGGALPASGEGSNQHHYFESETLEEIKDHDYEAEMLFYRELESRTAPKTKLFTVQRLNIYD